MQCYTELTSPTAVTHSLSLNFTSASANNLVIARTSLLQFFSLKNVLTEASHTISISDQARRASANGPGSANLLSGGLQRGERASTTKLVLIAQYELSGTVTSLARISIPSTKSGGEALLVSLRNAKVSLVEWDPERYGISTISIHLYERDDTQGNPWDPDLEDQVSYLIVDPRSRCAALKFGARHLAILPFHQHGDDLAMDDYDSDIDGDKPKPTISHAKSTQDNGTRDKTPYGASFVVSMLALEPSLLHPRHLAFLYEYREPTFGILSSQIASSISLFPERHDTLSYTVITLDLEQRASTALLSVSNLPYDLSKVVPLGAPTGGALLIGDNELIHVDQAGKTNGVAVNGFAKTGTSFALADQSDLRLRLEGAAIEPLGPDSSELLLIMATGELAIVGFRIDGRSVSGLTVRRVLEQNGGGTLLAGPSCASCLGRGRMFVGSEDADSVVLGWSRRLDKLKRQRSTTEMEANEEVDISDVEDDIDDDDDDLYAAPSTEKKKEVVPTPATSDQTDDYRFRAHDYLENFGPIRAVALGKPPKALVNDNKTTTTTDDRELLAAVGRGRAGALTTFRQAIDPYVLEQHLLPNVTRFFPVSTFKSSEGLQRDRDSFHNYILASTTKTESDPRSAAYSLTSSGLKEVQDTDFDPEAGATLDVGTLHSGSRIIQVLSSELRSYDASESTRFTRLPSFSNCQCFRNLDATWRHLMWYAIDGYWWVRVCCRLSCKMCILSAGRARDVASHVVHLPHSINERLPFSMCTLCLMCSAFRAPFQPSKRSASSLLMCR